MEAIRGLELTSGLKRALQIAPEQVATVFGDRTGTWREVGERVGRLASVIAEAGLRPGEAAAILSLNSDRHLELFYALAWMGGVSNPLNTRFALPELEYCVSDSGARILFYGAGFADTAAELLRRCPQLIRIVGLDEEGGAPGSEYETLIAQASPRPDVGLRGEEPALIIYTGGTTGAPKGVLLTVSNVLASVTSMLWTGLGRDGSAALHIAPMFHVSGALAVFIWTGLGGRHIFIPKFEPSETLRLVEAHRPTSIILAPTMLQMLFEDPSFPERDLSSLKTLIYGMSPMPEALLRRARDMLPHVGFLQAYGQTETTGAVAFLYPDDHVFEGDKARRLRAAGRPHPMVQLAIRDAEGRELGPNEAGEICVRSPLVMAGYLNKPAATAEACRDGWLHTGDVGRLDDDGYLFVIDRLKDMIISGGENVYSAEVENALAAHPDVRMCAVLGVPDPLWGERVHAIVTVRPEAATSAESLIAHCRGLVAGYKCPRSIELRAEDLPLTAAGKVAKAELRAALQA